MIKLILHPGQNVRDAAGNVYRVLDKEQDVYFIAKVSGADSAFYIANSVDLSGVVEGNSLELYFVSSLLSEAYGYFRKLAAERAAELNCAVC